SNNQKPTVEQLRNFLKESLPDYMIPAVFIEVTEFPLTPNGKLNRKALSLKPVEVTSTEAITEAVTDVEKRVLAIWRDVLSNNQIGVENTFFEVGGDSISAVYVTEKISHEFNCQVGVTSLFKYPDVKRLANFVSKLQKLPATPTVNSTDPIISVEKSYQLPSYYEESIAVIGISCRFSKAEDQYEFWEKLLAGEEFIDLLSKEVLHKAGLASELINSSHFVPAQSLISGKDLFDADFFNIMPRDAEYMDPQLRFLLLHSWGAVEDAGYCVEKIPSTGVFMTASNSFYHALLPNIAPQSKKVLTKPSEYVAWVLAQGGTIPTMISYRLGLKGPSFFVHSNCSSSLVGLHVARQSLLSGECDYALVGAAALSPSTNYGYIYQDGLNFSADGHVKTFDNSADGMVGGEGVAVILMKRAVDAIRDGDNIYALLRSTAINNDGSDKVGFYAPSISGQANVIEQALQSSGVAPSSICYVEAHGTGTRLGDPIEIAALSEVYTKQTDREQYCGVGSVKTNLGHLDAAAGLAGIVKLSLSLKNGVIPPSINYLQENQEIKFENTPFYVVDKVVNFPERAEPIRAAISSFGLGGTNTHAIFEQYKESGQTSKNGLHLVPLSAKSSDRLIAYADKLLQFLSKKKDLSIADIAYTLQIGRKAMGSRVAFLADSVDSLIKDLQTYCQSLPSSTTIVSNQTETRKIFDKIQSNSNILNIWYQEKDLSSIAKAWVTGIDIDWSKFSVGGCRISLPTYPFAQEKFWAPGVFGNLLNEDGRLQPASATSSLHPLVHRNTSDLTEQRFSSSLSGKEFFLADHLILGKPTLPAVAYLEMAYTAVTFAIRGFNPTKQLVKIKNTVWSRPLTVSSRPVEVHIALTPDVDGQITYKIYQGDEEQVHSIGTVEVIEKLPAPQQNLNQLSEKCSLVKLSGSDCYAAFKSAGVDYGSGHQGLSSISIGSDNDGEHIALAKLTLPKSVSDTASLFQLHPSLLDSALQVSIVLQSQSSGLDMTLPYSLGSVILYEHCPSSAWVVVKTKGGNNRRVLSHDIDICDESGRVCIRLEDFVSRRVDVAPSQSLEHQTLLFVPEWVKSSALSKIDTYDRFLILCGIEKEGISFTEEKLISLTSNETLLHRQFTDYALQLKQCLNSLMKARLKPTLVQVVVSNSILSGLAGLLKSARQENPSLLTQLIEIRETLSRVLLQEIIDENSKTTDDLHVLYEGGERKTLRWIEREFDRNTSTKFWRNDGIYLITGGAGEIGLKVASEIITSTHLARVVLVGRSSSEEKVATRLQHIDAKRVEYIRANVAEREEVEKLLSTVKEKYGDLHGIIHSAGLIRDSYLAYKSDEEFIEVLTPKVNGLFWLDELSQEFSLELFILFSSISGIFGNAGQADYAAANAFCDAYAHYRMTLVEAGKRRGKTVSIDWPLWKMGGMQIPEQIAKVLAKEKGLVVLPDDEGLGTLYDALDSGSTQLLVLYGEVAKIRTALESSVSEQKEQVMTVSAQEQHVAFSRDEELTSLVINYLKDTVSEAIRLSSDKIDAKASFETFGIDSIMITELTSILEKQFGSLPKTLFFEYQNLQELAQYFVDSHTQKVRKIFAPVPRSTNESNKDVAKQASVKNASSVNKRFVVEPGKSSRLQGQKADRKDIAIIGISGRYPKAGNLEEFWENLRQGRDCITEIPKERWDHSLYFDEDKNKFGKTYSKWGGFVDDVDKFDAMFFNISPREAEYMDPQERLFMEAVYEAIEDAGYTRENLASRKEAGLSGNVGVFAGMMYEEYQLYGAQETLLGRPIALSGSPASIANRVSYFCNFHGPSVAVDTMCSSSLTAIHFACLSLQEGDCEVAIAGGVNVSIHPNKYLMLGQGKFVSSKGRCESFGLGGDGYVPAEGVGVVLLKPLERAIEDGDQIYAVIKGTSINHGGKVSGYSVPNPNAQAAVIQKAIERAGIHPETISYIEAHGTGTVLGDPIEIASLTKCFSQYTSRKQFCAIGSVKSNVGHCESAAGVCGLTKVLLQMKYKQLVPSLHSELLNPNIDFTSSPFVVQQSLTEWKRPVVNLDGIEKEYPRRAGISSFGAGGANAHIILEEYISEPINFSDTSPAILLLSTKSESQLRRAAERLLKTLNSNSYEEKDLHSICYTLQVGREAMDYRLAIVATSIEQIKESLTAFLTNQKNFQDLYTGHAKSNQDLLSMFNSDDDMTQTIEAWLLKGKYSKVCQYWVKGGVVNWNLLYQDKKIKRLSLPSYPFEKERFWVPVVEQQPIYSTNVYQSATNGHTKALDREFYGKLLDELILDQITVDQATKQVLNAVKKQ
ncbi:MAG: SDR family NAD(P)-dependent oxidoreductase, partial [Blastocatellia bacterium]|nr:SDR family NAD(P)-dependent oxidoreductase [Blastocatellia bacterium]